MKINNKRKPCFRHLTVNEEAYLHSTRFLLFCCPDRKVLKAIQRWLSFLLSSTAKWAFSTPETEHTSSANLKTFELMWHCTVHTQLTDRILNTPLENMSFQTQTWLQSRKWGEELALFYTWDNADRIQISQPQLVSISEARYSFFGKSAAWIYDKVYV